ncbi:MAG: LPS assembly protein LptD [Opitutus sp.]
MIRRLLLFLTASASLIAAEGDPTEVYAEHSSYSIATGETILTGSPRIDFGDVRMTADELRYNAKTRIVNAVGHAIITKGPRRLLADNITYNSIDGTFSMGDLRMGEYPIYLAGSSASGNLDSITITDARATIPEPGALIPTLQAGRLFFGKGNRLHAQRASVGVGPIRPLALRGYEHNVRSPLLTYVSATGGYRRTLGVFAEAGLHLPITDQLRLGADLGLYSSRGIMFGPSGTYSGGAPDAAFRGSFRSGFISDYGDRFTDVLGRPVPKNRGYAEWNHQQQITENLTLIGQLNYWRDSEIVRDFRPSEFFRVQQPDTFVESVYSTPNYLVSLFARFQPNTFHRVQQRLPELRFDLLPLAVGNGFYERFNASVVALRDNPPGGGPTLSSDRLDAYYALSRPIKPSEWLTFTPLAGARVTHYADLQGPRSDYTRTLGEIGFDSEMRISGTFEYKNPRLKIDGLRHLFTPRLSYRYLPEAEKGARYIPQIDRRSFSTYLQPLGLGDTRNIDELHRTNTLRLGFDNTLQTRDPVYGSRDLVVLNVANDFRFDRTPRERRMSEIHSELALMPARWLELGVYSSFAPQDLTLREFNTGITVRDGQEWEARFSSNFLRGELNDYFLEGSRRFNEVFDGTIHLRYDARKERFNEQMYGIRHNIGNTWRIEYLITLFDGPRRESRFGFSVRVGVLRF